MNTQPHFRYAHTIPKPLYFVKALPYEELQEAKKLLQRGADYTLMYFWYNLLRRNYPEMGTQNQVVEKDKMHFKTLYPLFAQDIEQWVERYNKK